MWGTAIVAFGLGLDAVGALAVVVPDFDRRFQYKIRKITPFARKYHQSMMAFYAKGGQVEDSETLMAHLSVLWPLLQDDQSELEEVSFEQVSNAYWTDERAGDDSAYIRLVLEGRSGDELTTISLGKIGSPVQDYLEDKYRFWGWILLAVGFVIQFVGTLYPAVSMLL